MFLPGVKYFCLHIDVIPGCYYGSSSEADTVLKPAGTPPRKTTIIVFPVVVV